MVRGNKFKPGEPPRKKQRLSQDQTEAPSRQADQAPLPKVTEVDTVNKNIPGPRKKPVDSQHKATQHRTAQVKRPRENSNAYPNGASEHSKAAKMQKRQPQGLESVALDVTVSPLQKTSQPTTQSQFSAPAAPKHLTDAGALNAKADASKSLAKPSTNKRKKARQKAKLREKLRLKGQQQPDQAANSEKYSKPQGEVAQGPGKPKDISQASWKKSKLKPKPKPLNGVHSNVLTSTALPVQGSTGNSNWEQIKKLIGAGVQKDRHLKGDTPLVADTSKRPEPKGTSQEITPIVAVDCEMVGVGPDGVRSSLARVCIVNDQGNVLLDKFVRQKEKVTDYRTKFSGIRPKDVADDNAEPFEDVQKEAAAIFKGRIIVGHAIQNDLGALLLGHPGKLVRDTARYPPLMRPVGPGRKPKPRALRHLAFEHLGLGIQSGEHSPVEDARAALYLYQRHAKVWEKHLQRGTLNQLRAPPGKQKIQGLLNQSAKKSLEALASQDIMTDL